MLVPISWLKEYVEIDLRLKDLMWKMTEIGMATESYQKVGKEIVMDVEVTPNRPDWMSIVGIAREIAALQGKKIKNISIPDLPKPKKKLPMEYKIDFDLFERWTAIIISGIKIKPSPKWMQKRLELIGLRPINNIVDITNYVMFELGIPMHAFDYDEIKGHKMQAQRAKGGEKFTSVDELSYVLPKNAMIIRDAKRLIDLAGIKGGLNSGIKKDTKNILLHVTIDNPVLTRRSSQALGLRSEASSIYERGPDKGGTVKSLKRATNLILKYAGGQVASEISDLKKEAFKPWKLELDLKNLEKILGIKIEDKKVINILSKLNLNPLQKDSVVKCTIPTYRGDLKIEEDLIEEVARFYGYNNFPKTLPYGTLSKETAPYYYDRGFEIFLKNLLVASGFTESLTLSLISKNLVENCNLNIDNHIKIANPVSRDLKLFEYNKVYSGELGKTNEPHKLSAITTVSSFGKIKGIVDLVLEKLSIENVKYKQSAIFKGLWHPVKSGVIEKSGNIVGTFGQVNPDVLQNLGIEKPAYALELDVSMLQKLSRNNIFNQIPENPPQIEDVTLTLPPRVMISEVIACMKKVKYISKVELIDTYKDSFTFRVYYQHPTKTLDNKKVDKIRRKMLSNLKKFGAHL
jgi:phenylalanyl-tRNA synthetase beta chain